MIAAPVLYMVKEGVAEALEAFVAGGGTLITGFMSGIVDQSDNVHLGGYPGPLRKLCGVWAEEIDALAPGQQNSLRFPDGFTAPCSLLCDILHLEGAEPLAHYGEDFYAGTPAVTRNRFGKGTVYYVGTQPDEAGLARVLDRMAETAGIRPLLPEDTPLEVTRRVKDGKEYRFLLNFTRDPQPVPASLRGQSDLLTGSPLPDTLAPYGVLLVQL